MGAKASDVIAGGSIVTVGLGDEPFYEGLKRAEARLKAFASAAVAIGVKLSGFGLGLGAGLLSSVKSFTSLGSELDTVRSKLATVSKDSPEFAKLTKEAERLAKIMGGADLAAALKLGNSFSSLGDSIRAVVVTFGAGLAPALSKMVDYVKGGVDAVGEFIRQHKALAPQAAVVVAGLTAIGLAIAALGATFYVFGPVIRLSMGIASVATLAFNLVMATLTTTVAIASATLKILTGTVLVAAAVIRALHVVTISTAVGMTVLNLAVRAVGVTVGIITAVIKTLTISVVSLTATIALTRLGFTALAGALNLFMGLRTAVGVFSLLSGAIGLLLSPIGLVVVAAGAILALGVPLVATFVRWSGAAEYLADAFATGFTAARDAVASAFSGILSYVGSSVGAISTALSGIVDTAKQAFGQVLNAARSVFESGRKFFMDLFATAKTTFQGISDAVAAGDMQLAMDVLWAGLQVTWVKGCDGLKAAWQTAMIYIEGALDGVATNLQMAWEVALITMEGAFDKFSMAIRNKMQDVSNTWAKWIAKTGVFGAVDDESIDEENRERKKALNKGVEDREADRNKRLANTGDDAGLARRAKEREDRMKQVGQASPELAALEAKLAELAEKAKAAKPKPTDEQTNKVQQGTKAATSAAVAAQSRNSAGAASTIAAAVNRSMKNPNAKLEAEAKTTNKQLAEILKKPGIGFVEIV